MTIWRKILWPLVPLYALGVGIRNKLFDLGWLKTVRFTIPVIVVGNISAGGTGKTPMVEFLLKNLADFKTGFISRGYGRKTKGVRIISSSDKPADIGDEPWQIMQKFPQMRAAVAEKRVQGIKTLLNSNAPELIVLDDAFQHRYVKGSLTILLTTWNEPFFNDHLLPAGNLREGKRALHRADLIIITKCPANLTKNQSAAFAKKLKAGNRPIYFSSLEYGTLQNQDGEAALGKVEKVNLLTGIAKPQTLVDKVKTDFKLQKHWRYADHHPFSKQEIERLEQSSLPLITTEKDWGRLKNLVSPGLAKRIFPWPVQIKILFDEEKSMLAEIRKRMLVKIR